MLLPAFRSPKPSASLLSSTPLVSDPIAWDARWEGVLAVVWPDGFGYQIYLREDSEFLGYARGSRFYGDPLMERITIDGFAL